MRRKLRQHLLAVFAIELQTGLALHATPTKRTMLDCTVGHVIVQVWIPANIAKLMEVLDRQQIWS